SSAKGSPGQKRPLTLASAAHHAVEPSVRAPVAEDSTCACRYRSPQLGSASEMKSAAGASASSVPEAPSRNVRPERSDRARARAAQANGATPNGPLMSAPSDAANVASTHDGRGWSTSTAPSVPNRINGGSSRGRPPERKQGSGGPRPRAAASHTRR